MSWLNKFVALVALAAHAQAFASKVASQSGQFVLDGSASDGQGSLATGPSLHIKVEGRGCETFKPDVATMEVRIYAENETESIARAEFDRAEETMSRLINSSLAMAEWKQFSLRSSNNAETSRPSRFRGLDKDEEPTYSFSRRLTGHLDSVDLVTDLATNLTSLPNVQVRWVNWALLEETERAARFSTSKKAMKQCFENGRVYADALGYTTLKLVEVDEQYNYVEEAEEDVEKHGRMYFFDDSSDDFLTPRNLESCNNVKCAFILS